MTMSPDHPDFEDLSAFHDGEAPEWSDHLAGCGSCRKTLAELGALSEAVTRVPLPARPAGPATTPGDDFADPVAQAVLSAGASSSAQGAALARGLDGGIGSRTGGNEGGSNEGGGDPSKGRRRQWVLAGSSAAVLAVSIAIGATVASKGPHQEMTRDALPTGGTRSTAQAGDGLSPGTVIAGGNLGEIADRATLVARVGTDLRTRNQGQAAQAAPRSPAANVPTAPRPCETEARADPGDRGELIYQATAVDEGAPAVVLAFGSARGSPSVTVEVRAVADCRLLLQGAIL